jgi:RNA polymerase sigma-70 factor (ECF subfamily)
VYGKKDKTYLDTLIKQCIQNERSAQEKLYKLFFQDMYLFCKKWIQDEDVIISVVNDSFLKIFVNLAGLKSLDSFSAWTKTIVRNTLYDHFRKTNEPAIQEEHNALHIQDNGIHLDEPFIEKEFETMLESLPKTTREIFIMFAMEGYGHSDIAKQYNITEGTSRWHVAHARKILQLKWIELE